MPRGVYERKKKTVKVKRHFRKPRIVIPSEVAPHHEVMTVSLEKGKWKLVISIQ